MLSKLLRMLLVAAAVVTVMTAPVSADQQPSAVLKAGISVETASLPFKEVTVRKGTRGNDVRTLQHKLNVLINAGLVEDGICGTATIAVVKKYQGMEGITADGICGATTWRHLNQDYSDLCNGLVRNGSVGTLVKEFQHLYNVIMGGNLSEDGICGAKTVAAIRNYQASRGLTVDGIAGKATFTALRAEFQNRQNPVTVNTNSQLQAYLNSLVGCNAVNWGGKDSSTQCVELPKYYIQQWFGIKCQFVGLGNGNTLYKGIVSAYPDQFERIDYYDGFMPKVGDIISYNSKYHPSLGHAAIVIAVDPVNRSYTIAEQWAGIGKIIKRTETVKAPVKGVSYTIIGVARPK